MQGIGEHQRPRNRETHCPGLTRLPAAIHMRLHVEGTQGVRRREGLLDMLHQRRPREIIAERAPIDLPLAGTRSEIHPRDTGLAPADRVPAELIFTHALTVRAKGFGCWA